MTLTFTGRCVCLTVRMLHETLQLNFPLCVFPGSWSSALTADTLTPPSSRSEERRPLSFVTAKSQVSVCFPSPPSCPLHQSVSTPALELLPRAPDWNQHASLFWVIKLGRLLSEALKTPDFIPIQRRTKS